MYNAHIQGEYMKFNLSPLQKKLVTPIFVVALPFVAAYQGISAIFLSLTGQCDGIVKPDSKNNWFDALGNHIAGLEVEDKK